MRSQAILLAGLCGAAVAASASLAQTIDKQDFKQIERGRYLTVAGDCAACHTLPGSGRDLAGGRAIETPFVRLLAPNITPDPQTGIGAWTDDEFVNASPKARAAVASGSTRQCPTRTTPSSRATMCSPFGLT
jgi:mono/diheme cytochrome c family protein